MWTQYPDVQALMMMSMSERFPLPPHPAGQIKAADAMVGLFRNFTQTISTATSNKNMRRFHIDLIPSDPFVNYYLDSNEVHLLVTPSYVQVLKGKSNQVQVTLSRFKDKIVGYLLGAYSDANATGDNDLNSENESDEAEASVGNTRGLKGGRSFKSSDYRYSPLKNETKKRIYTETTDFIETDNFHNSNKNSSSSSATSRSPMKSNYNRNNHESGIKCDISKFEVPSLTSNSPERLVTQYGSLPSQDIILLNVVGRGSWPSDEALVSIRRYHNVLKIGKQLRDCSDPDFIVRAVGGQRREFNSNAANKSDDNTSNNNHSNSNSINNSHSNNSEARSNNFERDAITSNIDWLLPAISADIIGIIHRLPLETVSHLLSMMSAGLFEHLNELNFWRDHKDIGAGDLEEIITAKNTLLMHHFTFSGSAHEEITSLDPFANFGPSNDVGFLLALTYSKLEIMRNIKLIISLSFRLLIGLFAAKNPDHSSKATLDSSDKGSYIKTAILQFFFNDLSSDSYSRRSGCQILMSLFNNILALSENLSDLDSESSNEVNQSTSSSGNNNKMDVPEGDSAFESRIINLENLMKFWCSLFDEKTNKKGVNDKDSENLIASSSNQSNCSVSTDKSSVSANKNVTFLMSDFVDLVVTPALLDGPFQVQFSFSSSSSSFMDTMRRYMQHQRNKFSMFSKVFEDNHSSLSSSDNKISGNKLLGKSQFLNFLENIVRIDDSSTFQLYANAVENSLCFETNNELIIHALNDLNLLAELHLCESVSVVSTIVNLFKSFRMYFLNNIMMKHKFITNMVNFALKSVIKALCLGVPLGKFIVVDSLRSNSLNNADSSAITLDESLYQPLILNGFRSNSTR
jgi:hypothetical protein